MFTDAAVFRSPSGLPVTKLHFDWDINPQINIIKLCQETKEQAHHPHPADTEVNYCSTACIKVSGLIVSVAGQSDD